MTTTIEAILAVSFTLIFFQQGRIPVVFRKNLMVANGERSRRGGKGSCSVETDCFPSRSSSELESSFLKCGNAYCVKLSEQLG